MSHILALKQYFNYIRDQLSTLVWGLVGLLYTICWTRWNIMYE